MCLIRFMLLFNLKFCGFIMDMKAYVGFSRNYAYASKRWYVRLKTTRGICQKCLSTIQIIHANEKERTFLRWDLEKRIIFQWTYLVNFSLISYVQRKLNIKYNYDFLYSNVKITNRYLSSTKFHFLFILHRNIAKEAKAEKRN